MPGVLSWTDAAGPGTLANGYPAGRRAGFQGWTPLPRMLADDAEALTGVAHQFKFADLYDVAFRLEEISYADGPTAARLVRHLRTRGLVSVATGDSANRTYPACQAPVGMDPVLEMDRRTRLWTLSVTLRNVAVVPVEMLCLYG